MPITHDAVAKELQTYPITGRFLVNRLRHEMTARERAQVEHLVERVEWVDGDTRMLERGRSI